MEYLKIAEEFGKRIWPYKNQLKFEDLMLFGSVAYCKENPTDLDILVLHYNEKLENFQDTAESKINDLEKLTKLNELFNEEINLLGLIQGTSIEKLISQNKFNVKYMDIKFFTDNEYRKKWREKNLKTYGLTPKARLPGETFDEAIFRQGLLYNQGTQKYDLPALQKYNFKINSQLQSQLSL